MAGIIKDSFLDLERHWQLLEENIDKLRRSLRHWQTWEAEYEGLKEEIIAARSSPNRTQLVVLAHGYKAELVNRKEVDEILGSKSRDAAQVVNILDRRLDYVEQNVKTIQKQIEAAVNKLAEATIISTPHVRNEEGLPLTEIMEELDEEDNIISSHITTPANANPRLIEVLKKSGVKDLPASNISSKFNTMATMQDEKGANKQNDAEPKTWHTVKKGVTFTEDTKFGPEVETTRAAKRLGEIIKAAQNSEAQAFEPPTIPVNETLEEAELRKEMLQYGISEVGAVVAELSLEESSDWSEGDYDDETSIDEEDAFGRSTGSIVDDDLRQRMIELEQRLGARFIENIGNKASDPGLVKDGVGPVIINGHQETPTDQTGDVPMEPTSMANSKAKNAVEFSEELSISPAPQQQHNTAPIAKTTLATIGNIVERSSSNKISMPLSTKVLKSKSSRGSTTHVLNGPLASPTIGPSLPLQPLQSSTSKPFSQPIALLYPEDGAKTAPTGPKGRTLATTVIERDISLDPTAMEPDELDPQLLYQEVAVDYNRLRNRMIQRQGGFVKEEESKTVPFSEEEGGPKKMSRFKAARLAQS